MEKRRRGAYYFSTQLLSYSTTIVNAKRFHHLKLNTENLKLERSDYLSSSGRGGNGLMASANVGTGL